MGQKLRDIISEIAVDLKAKNYDDRISYRYINSKFRSKLDYFMRLESKSREFVRDYTLWKKIKLQELEEIGPDACGLLDVCKTLKRSTADIPETISTAYGKLIRVFGLDDATEYTFIKSVDYKNYINRKFIKHTNVFWIDENRIIIPNTINDYISIYLIPKDESEVDKLNGVLNECQTVLDSELSYPDYLITLAKQETIKEILGGYQRITEDEKGDDNSNIKN